MDHIPEDFSNGTLSTLSKLLSSRQNATCDTVPWIWCLWIHDQE